MEIDKRKEEQRDRTGYGSAERPVVVTHYPTDAAKNPNPPTETISAFQREKI